ncbi:LacI family transcriptional regulator [Myceligenerans sp. I2]|uniref:LacI family transcriptional regulator n=1 Tax=Myceligenerans indicum TaxID=2593663 RepID=A0ABS1LK38_9MICO|nr:LacI family transcriptional regulator [Myceligenerans indicum]
MRDVAEVAGVSPSTASRVLNGDGRGVREELRIRVLAVADALGYVSNQAARALRGRRSGVVLLASDPRTASIAAMAAGMEEAGRERGVAVSITAVGPDTEAHLAALRILRGLRPIALVVTSASFVGTESTRILQELEAAEREGVHIVFIGEHDYAFPSVRFDDVAIGHAVAAHMATLGRARPAVLTSQGHPAVEARTRGFLAGLGAAGYDAASIAVESSPVTRAGGNASTGRLLRRREKPDMILAGNDLLAIGALHALRDAGLEAPRDVALSGVDDIPIARDLTPSLTTVSLPFDDAGRAALALALDTSNRSDIHLDSTIVVRESTRG